MNELHLLLEEMLTMDLEQLIISNPKSKETNITKIKIRPVLHKNELVFQSTCQDGKQVFHQNYSADEIIAFAEQNILEIYKQFELTTIHYRVTGLVSKHGKVTIKKKRLEEAELFVPRTLSHNREKRYILKEGMNIPFLVDLGVFTKEFQIVRVKYDKFRQINRFLEFIEDILPKLPTDHELNIIDFGCGKSYLTFAMYYYLHELKHYQVSIVGLDLKAEVIKNCNQLSERYGYRNLHFEQGDIKDYSEAEHVDMVVTLHACDTATDYALYKAVGWDAKVILSVPCCQHELNEQISNELMKPVLKYGLLKERIAALMTDGIRAEYLEQMGYQVNVMEFIDMEHTPKNILLRAVKTGSRKKTDPELSKLLEEFHLEPTLKKLINES
ncbi:MAG: SAM-dependent methyltransferase [Clostridia bacterium]|nr:SAM-dependent methyltransferase [Clostridia bacterium]